VRGKDDGRRVEEALDLVEAAQDEHVGVEVDDRWVAGEQKAQECGLDRGRELDDVVLERELAEVGQLEGVWVDDFDPGAGFDARWQRVDDEREEPRARVMAQPGLTEDTRIRQEAPAHDRASGGHSAFTHT
jgi:hypothetical protein